MSFRGTLLRSGIDSDGIDVTFYRSDGVVTFAGNAVFEGDIEITGDVTFTGGFTLGDSMADTTILNSRFATGAVAGSALDVDASVYQYSEELNFGMRCLIGTTLTLLPALGECILGLKISWLLEVTVSMVWNVTAWLMPRTLGRFGERCFMATSRVQRQLL